MYNYGIVICLENSNNLDTIKHRTKNLINNLKIQYEIPHPISTTTGCFNSHKKALKNSIDILSNNKNLNYIIIAEEDININYNSKKYNNLILCLKQYNKNSNYILHLGGLPKLNENFLEIFKNDYDKIKLKSRIYLTTAYVVNENIAKKLLNVLNNSSNHIHCDAIFAYCDIDQYLVKGNLVNQIDNKSKNTFLHNYFSTKILSEFLLKVNKLSILFLNNIYIFIINLLIILYIKKYVLIFYEFIFLISKHVSKKIIQKKYNKYLPKYIFTLLEFFLIFRILTLLNFINI